MIFFFLKKLIIFFFFSQKIKKIIPKYINFISLIFLKNYIYLNKKLYLFKFQKQSNIVT